MFKEISKNSYIMFRYFLHVWCHKWTVVVAYLKICFLWWGDLLHFLHYFICLVDCYLLWRLEVLLLLSLFHQHRLVSNSTHYAHNHVPTWKFSVNNVMRAPLKTALASWAPSINIIIIIIIIIINWLQSNMASDWLILQFSFMESSTSLEGNTNVLCIFTYGPINCGVWQEWVNNIIALHILYLSCTFL